MTKNLTRLTQTNFANVDHADVWRTTHNRLSYNQIHSIDHVKTHTWHRYEREKGDQE